MAKWFDWLNKTKAIKAVKTSKLSNETSKNNLMFCGCECRGNVLFTSQNQFLKVKSKTGQINMTIIFRKQTALASCHKVKTEPECKTKSFPCLQKKTEHSFELSLSICLLMVYF